MTVQTREPVLRRKLAPHTPPPSVIPSAAMTGPAQGVGRSFARALTAAAQLVAKNGKTTRQTISQPELLDTIDTDAFVGLLSAGDAGPALAILDQSGFSAIIEAMTIGRLGPRASSPRRPTPTDASLLTELIDKTLEGLDGDLFASLRFAQAVPDHRLLSVLLDDTQFDVVTHSVTLFSGGEERTAELTFAFPAIAEPAKDPLSQAADTENCGSAWTQALETAVMRAPASLRAELGRVTIPLSEVLELGVGSALVLPLSNLEEVQLVALDGSAQAAGRLGQSRGMRAVRLTSWPNGKAPQQIMTELTSPAPPALTPAPKAESD